MAIAPSILESDVFNALRLFLLSILPAGMEVILGEINRVAEPEGDDFVVFTPVIRDRLGTNRHSYKDVSFVGSILDGVLTVTDLQLGALQVGSVLLGSGIHIGTVITSFETGSGGVGTYNILPPQY